MATSRHQLLNQALQMTQRMADLGHAGDWSEVIALEPKRRALLEQAFATHAPADEVITRQVQAILDLDKALMSQTIAARDGLAADISRATKGRKAATAYQSAGR